MRNDLDAKHIHTISAISQLEIVNVSMGGKVKILIISPPNFEQHAYSINGFGFCEGKGVIINFENGRRMGV